MRVFVYEYVCGGGTAGQDLPDLLASEGWAMLRSIVEDFARIPQCRVVSSLDQRFSGRGLAAHEIEVIGDAATEQRAINRLSASCDWTLLIAPEFNQILFDRTCWVEQAGGRLLGPESKTVSLAADKWLCAQRLIQYGVPSVLGEVIPAAAPCHLAGAIRYPAVLKPRNGAGSLAVHLLRSDGDVRIALNEGQNELPGSDFLVQPFLSGLPASASFLVGPCGIVPLQPGTQRLSDDGRLRFLGGRIPLPDELAVRARELGRRAVAALPGLIGYVGVDMVLSCERNARSPSETGHRGDVVIEINPRLTTSYVGLRELSHENLAERMIEVAAGRWNGPIRWRDGAIEFLSDGCVTRRSF